ncbi:alpha-amylase family glycosyl hydrolase [Roseibacillus persicicus]|uniref:alpha-amylase family glycosyl hydrolase n=1 Tax=Roseibacillus persicicus TaxID=454148 RepID=UPI00398B6B12
MKVFFLLAIWGQLSLAEEVTPPPSPVMVQLFDWTFAEIGQALPALQELGYSHIHVSPVQKSVENGKWWGKYQPLDYRVIEGPLGSREELVELARKATDRELTLVVDVVPNHMAGSPYVSVRRGRLREVRFADFSVEDFHPYAPIRDWSNVRQVRNRWLFGALPDLRTESEGVRAKLVAHLKDLQSCGVGGFRVDSARHIPPADLRAILGQLEEPGFVVGEIADHSLETFEPYLEGLPEMRFFDFPHLLRLAECLRGERAMSDLIEGKTLSLQLPPRASVSLLRNHDLDRGEANRTEGIDDPRYRIPDGAWQIGYAALFGMGEGVPYVFVDDPKVLKPVGREHGYNRPGLKEGISFFRATYGLQTRVLSAQKEALAWSLGDSAFMILQREAVAEGSVMPVGSLRTGRYRDVYTGVEIAVTESCEVILPALGQLQGYGFLLQENATD